MLAEKIIEYEQGRIKQYPVNSNRASQLGHECVRFLVFDRTRWQEKKLHDVSLQFVFDEGNTHERAVLSLLAKAGFTVIEQQKSFWWKEYNITGHIDGKVLVDGKAIPLEIKSAAAHSWQSISTAQDLYSHRYHYMRMYPAQMTLYLLMDNKEYGLFLFKNKQTGMVKEIRMELDYSLGESLLRKAERINAHVADNTIPEPIPYDEKICGECGYLHICLPDVRRDALDLTTDPELEGKLNRYFEIKPTVEQYNVLDDDIKAAFREHPKVVVGDYLITGKWIEPKGRPKYWKTNIQRLGV